LIPIEVEELLKDFSIRINIIKRLFGEYAELGIKIDNDQNIVVTNLTVVNLTAEAAKALKDKDEQHDKALEVQDENKDESKALKEKKEHLKTDDLTKTDSNDKEESLEKSLKNLLVVDDKYNKDNEKSGFSQILKENKSTKFESRFFLLNNDEIGILTDIGLA